jgi:ketosteroid isomerase-like protein
MPVTMGVREPGAHTVVAMGGVKALRMSGSDQLSRQYHRALEAFITGDPSPVLALWSMRDDTTLANPFGPPVRGRDAVRHAATRAASQIADGESFSVERISSFATPDLAYELEIHRFQAKMGGADELAPVSLRVTTIYRREADGWRVAHRHADQVTGVIDGDPPS